MPLLLTMSLFGSIGTLFYIVLKPLMKKYFSVWWRRGYLICNILEYLIPFPYFYAQYRMLLDNFSMDKMFPKSTVDLTYMNVTTKYIQVAVDRIHIPHVVTYTLIIGIIMAGLILLGKQIYKYRLMRSFLKNDSVEITGLEYDKIKQKIPKRIRIYLCGKIDSPFAIGVFRPVIVLPNLKRSELELSLIIEHEVTHIKQCDNLVKVLALAVLALNYNPLAYYILQQWNEVAELSCDARVKTGKSKEEIRLYGMLIIGIAESQPDNEKLPVMGLNSQGKILKERIQEMKKETTRESRLKKLVGAGVMGVVLVSSSLSVLAYSPKEVVHENEVYDNIYFSDDDALRVEADSEALLDEIVEYVFTSDDGETIIVDENEIDTHILCSHSYTPGTLVKHKKYSDGSCKNEYYDAKYCKWCDHIEQGELIKTVIWEKCPH